jgi:hypothetical protein
MLPHLGRWIEPLTSPFGGVVQSFPLEILVKMSFDLFVFHLLKEK